MVLETIEKAEQAIVVTERLAKKSEGLISWAKDNVFGRGGKKSRRSQYKARGEEEDRREREFEAQESEDSADNVFGSGGKSRRSQYEAEAEARREEEDRRRREYEDREREENFRRRWRQNEEREKEEKEHRERQKRFEEEMFIKKKEVCDANLKLLEQKTLYERELHQLKKEDIISMTVTNNSICKMEADLSSTRNMFLYYREFLTILLVALIVFYVIMHIFNMYK